MAAATVAVVVAARLFPSIVLLSSLIYAADEAEKEYQLIARTCGNVRPRNGTSYQVGFWRIRREMFDRVQKQQAMYYQNEGMGQPPDKMYVLGECYNYLGPIECQACLSQAASNVDICFSKTGGRIYLDGCFVRADNYSFFEEVTSPLDSLRCGIGKNDSSEFVAAAKELINVIASMAPQSNTSWVIRKSNYNGTLIYGMAKCWHTLDPRSCERCLQKASVKAALCLPSTEARVLNAGCFLHYSDNVLPPGQLDSHSGDSPFSYIYYFLVSIVVCTLLTFIVVFGSKIIITRRRMERSSKLNDAEMDLSVLKRGLQFKYSTLEKATGHFSEAHKLGQGGYGEVFKGILPDGREIAIKRLFVTGKSRGQEVYNELDIISRAQHKNLVRFLGCCFTDEDSLLVYEFLPNRSLDLILFDPEKKKELDWKKRFGIILGTAEGLEYLHKDCQVRIIHRDIKASNILLDLRHRAKISDFGLARFNSRGTTLVSTTVAGTLGYMAPEYLAQGRLTEKVDVYGYGVLMLEIISGVTNNEFEPEESLDTLVTITWKHFQSNTVAEIIDKSMQNADIEEIKRVVHVGLLCTQESPALRPSMTTVTEMLTRKDMELPAPSKPPFTDESMAISCPLDSPQRQLSHSRIFQDTDHNNLL